MKQFEGAIFDMDGTLTDSMYIWDTAGENYLKSCGKTPHPNLREQLRPLSLSQAAELFQKEYNIAEDVDEILKGFDRVVENEYKTNVILKPGVKELLQNLKNQRVRMAVATSSPREIVSMVLTRLDIAPYFSYIVTCGEVGLGKDHPAVYDRAAELIGTDKTNTIVFEDALHAIITAKEAGYYVVGVYDESEGINEDKIIPLCDQYLKTLLDFSYSEQNRLL